MFRKQVIIFFCLFPAACNICFGQNEYFGTLDYQNLTFTRLAPIASVTWLVADNAAYDLKHHRYVFLGNATGVPPWYLYTVDAATGTVLSRVICPANYNSSDNIFGLQFDNTSGILYALYSQRATQTIYFSSIDPSTGNITLIAAVPGLSGYANTESTFSSAHHLYFFGGSNSQGAGAINALTGQLVWATSNVSLANIAFDNANDKLYALQNNTSSYIQFDSIELNTGITHKISTLPAMYLPQLPTTTIDENNGRYIFLGADTAPCISNRLYVVDVNNGRIVSNRHYPYAQNVALPGYENVLNFSFDNIAGKLYALNWHVGNDSIAANKIHITASANPVCSGDLVTFNAKAPVVFQNPVYQWIVNSSPAATSASTFITDQLSDGDTVYCIVTDNLPCDKGLSDTSNFIVEQVGNSIDSAFYIAASTATICQGDTAIFVAYTNAAPASLTWKVNGIDAGHGDSLVSHSLVDGDKVNCVEANGTGCTLPINSIDTITMKVLLKPAISFSSDTIVLNAGSSLTLIPNITGPAQVYSWSPSKGLSDTTIADPVASPLIDTKYFLTAGVPEGCFSVASIFVKVIYPDSLSCLDFSRVKVYPNPSIDKVLVDFGAVWKSGEIIVFNAAGQRMSAIKIENKDHVYVYRNRFASGVYALKFICSQGLPRTLRVVFAE